MEIVIKAISQLKGNPKNPRVMTPRAIQAVRHSIKQFGYVVPIIVDEEDTILAGHTRLEALKAEGTDKVEVVILRGLTPQQKNTFNIIDNKTTELNPWDEDKLRELVVGIEEDLKKMGFDDEELTNLLSGKVKKEDNIPPIEETDIVVGDIFQLGQHKIICGDSSDEEVYRRLMGDERAKVCFTSPPYNMDGDMYANYSDDMKSEDYIKFNKGVLDLVAKFLDGFIFWNISYNRNSRWEFIDILHYMSHMAGFQFLELVCWNKKHGIPITSKEMMTRTYENVFVSGSEGSIAEDLEFLVCSRNNRKYVFNKKTKTGLTNYWELGTSGSQLQTHKACFPVELPSKGIAIMSDMGQIVLDPFTGSGTTLIAAEQLKRVFRGIELSPLYCEVSIKRWEQYTGSRRVKV